MPPFAFVELISKQMAYYDIDDEDFPKMIRHIYGPEKYDSEIIADIFDRLVDPSNSLVLLATQ